MYSDDSLDEYGNDEFLKYTTGVDTRSPSRVIKHKILERPKNSPKRASIL